MEWQLRIGLVLHEFAPVFLYDGYVMTLSYIVARLLLLPLVDLDVLYGIGTSRSIAAFLYNSIYIQPDVEYCCFISTP